MTTVAQHSTNSLNHRLFAVTLFAKAALGVLQLATAAAIFAGAAERLPGLTQWLFRAELAENPNDFLATRAMSLVGVIPTSDMSFYTTYFLAHGGLHIAIVVALLYGAAWAHRAAVFVLWAFVIYQLFEWLTVGGVALLILTAIDLTVIYITVCEQRSSAT
ncbi:DUF2127 domain-containing protein [Sulfitobacter sp.]|jgi:uncharacterized membrane protein|uniref:DUF2127 domain-containing protein n=1 Tax=Sulfitobacter sp. TaxID=1903071 RepID=UPI0026125BF5|nr:DUF2127 domain-containing protein [Sulfitobacter sp.]|tara:strand:+ start:698 stop:1180 length:483 start_codon:yes stop_codon:yes gene_type:complete